MNLTSSEYREIARESLRGHWPDAIITMILASLLGAFSASPLFISRLAAAMSGAIRLLESIPYFYIIIVTVSSVIAVFYFFIGGAVSFGYIDYNLALLDRRDCGVGKLFSRFSLIWKAVSMKLALFLVLLAGTCLFLVPGIILSYSYAMVPYILEERPLFSVTKAMRESRKMMKRHKWRLFCLRLSFLGWRILGILTLGLGNLYAIPYQKLAEAVFYNEISGRAATYYGREGE